jgi:hypothetical protein
MNVSNFMCVHVWWDPYFTKKRNYKAIILSVAYTARYFLFINHLYIFSFSQNKSKVVFIYMYYKTFTKTFIKSCQLHVIHIHEQSVPIAIIPKVVSSNLVHGEVYSIQHYVIKFVSDLRQIGDFLLVL